MKIERAALFDPGTGLFVADKGGGTLELHQIRIFIANEGLRDELDRWVKLAPYLEVVPCEGDWVTRYGVKNS